MLYPPSMIAAGCIGVAVRGLGIYPSVTEKLHKITGIELVSAQCAWCECFMCVCVCEHMYMCMSVNVFV